jgi:hypothetical protein
VHNYTTLHNSLQTRSAPNTLTSYSLTAGHFQEHLVTIIGTVHQPALNIANFDTDLEAAISAYNMILYQCLIAVLKAFYRVWRERKSSRAIYLL